MCPFKISIQEGEWILKINFFHTKLQSPRKRPHTFIINIYFFSCFYFFYYNVLLKSNIPRLSNVHNRECEYLAFNEKSWMEIPLGKSHEFCTGNKHILLWVGHSIPTT